MRSVDTISLFSNLPKGVQDTIDSAFNIAQDPNGIRYSKPRISSVELSGSGGFLVEESDIFESPQAETESNHSQIPFDAVPFALQRLDLPPDDEEILSVFRNAASGWDSQHLTSESHTEKRCISRDDWRAVCAVLLENRPDEDGLDVEGSDEYVDEINNNSESDDDLSNPAASEGDEYMEGLSSASRRSYGLRRSKSQRISSLSDERVPDSKNITQRQKQTCLDTYALFFPHTSISELEEQRITIRDLDRVTKLLNEKLKTAEMLEMLEMFSTSQDKSMGFEDFSCMMMTARLA